MENNTEEKSLVKVNDNIFAKIRSFFMLKFGKKQKDDVELENEILNISIKDEGNKNNGAELGKTGELEKIDKSNEIYEEKEELERKLMNYYASITKSN